MEVLFHLLCSRYPFVYQLFASSTRFERPFGPRTSHSGLIRPGHKSAWLRLFRRVQSAAPCHWAPDALSSMLPFAPCTALIHYPLTPSCVRDEPSAPSSPNLFGMSESDLRRHRGRASRPTRIISVKPGRIKVRDGVGEGGRRRWCRYWQNFSERNLVPQIESLTKRIALLHVEP